MTSAEAWGISKRTVRGGRVLLTATRYHLSGSRLAGNLALTTSKSSGSDSDLDAIVGWKINCDGLVGRMKQVARTDYGQHASYTLC